MKRLSIVALVMFGLLTGPAAAQSTASPVALVFGAAFDCRDVAAREPSCAFELLSLVRFKVGEAFVVQNGLGATSTELQRLTDYNRAFERHDRSQRARKLAELETRLAVDTLAPGERARLEGFRAVLSRLARYEADMDAGIEPRVPVSEATLRSWIETAKLNAALYAKYGGSIGIAAYGPYAHGAMRTLILEHFERGDIRISDPGIAARFFVALETPPRVAHTEGEPDFTPFWERPIPPSYMPN